jgi:hypothetical protein
MPRFELATSLNPERTRTSDDCRRRSQKGRIARNWRVRASILGRLPLLFLLESFSPAMQYSFAYFPGNCSATFCDPVSGAACLYRAVCRSIAASVTRVGPKASIEEAYCCLVEVQVLQSPSCCGFQPGEVMRPKSSHKRLAPQYEMHSE